MNDHKIEEETDQQFTPLPIERAREERSITSLPKAVVLNSARSKFVDQNMVAFQYYNSFNYSLLHKNDKQVRLAIGITSANVREGKSLVASNLAVSLTLGYKKKTVLVDLNMRHPVLHEVFGTSFSPGLVEALNDGNVNVWQTSIEHLHLVSYGGPQQTNGNGTINSKKQRRLGLDQMTAFTDVITSLQQEYEFVVVDMPSLNTEDFPILFANRLDGLLMVVDSNTTKRDDLEKVFRRVNENQVLGFILNRVHDENY